MTAGPGEGRLGRGGGGESGWKKVGGDGGMSR